MSLKPKSSKKSRSKSPKSTLYGQHNDNDIITKTIQIASSYNNEWINCQSRPYPAHYCGGPIFWRSSKTNKAYIIIMPYPDAKHVLKYDIELNKWQKIDKYPRGYRGYQIDIIKHSTNQLFVLGNGENVINIFDLLTQHWSYKKQTLSISAHQGCIMHDVIYLSHYSKAIISVYNTINNTVTTINSPLISSELFCINNKLYMFHGKIVKYDEKYSNKIYSLNNQSKWIQCRFSLPKDVEIGRWIIYTTFIILIEYKTQNILYLNIEPKHNNFVWNKLNITGSPSINSGSIVLTDDNILHLIDGSSRIHLKTSLIREIMENVSNNKQKHNNDDEKSNVNSMDFQLEKMGKIEKENKKLKQEIERLKEEKCIILSKYKKIEKDNILLKQENNNMVEECKELKLELNDIQQRYNKLEKLNKLKNVNINNYLQWTSDDIVDWILTINNGQFELYEEILRKSLNDEEIIGKYLKHLTINDLHRVGITKFKPKKDLFDAIQSLIDNNNKQHQYEGNNNADTAYI